jgi:hypothetical protein
MLETFGVPSIDFDEARHGFSFMPSTAIIFPLAASRRWWQDRRHAFSAAIIGNRTSSVFHPGIIRSEDYDACPCILKLLSVF